MPNVMLYVVMNNNFINCIMLIPHSRQSGDKNQLIVDSTGELQHDFIFQIL